MEPRHKQSVYAGAPVYIYGVEDEIFKGGFCLLAGPYVADEDGRDVVGNLFKSN